MSGGVEGAAKGTLAIMVGGSATALQRAEPVLRALGTTLTHFGPQGAGQAAKATNQIMVAGIIRANAEALAFAAAQGLALDKVIATLGRGAAANWYLEHRGPNMQRGSYPAGFRVRLHQKDLNICHAMARSCGVEGVRVDRAGDMQREIAGEGARNRRQIDGQAAKMNQQRTPARGPQARHGLEYRFGISARAPAPRYSWQRQRRS